jgi:TolB-like protein/DNA-binding winged helix-turn-helix (wHTH) protein
MPDFLLMMNENKDVSPQHMLAGLSAQGLRRLMDLAREPDFTLGGMRIRPSTREVVFDGGREILEPRVMMVLIRLARAKGEVVTRDDLTEACWEGRVVSDDAINRVISRIRRAADLTGGKDFTLETITKVGYRLVAGPERQAPVLTAQDAGQASGAAKAPAGVHRAKMPAGPIAALVLAVAAGAVWFFAFREPEWSPDPTKALTLAVLPFDSTGTPDDAGLAVGMSREIRNTLSRVRGLRVVSDASSFAVAQENLSAEQMGRRMMADYLLDGSFSRSGDTVTLSAELVDAWSGHNLWTGDTKGAASDLGRLRQEMSAAVFQELVKRIGPNRLEALAPPKPTDPRAYRLLVEAQELLESTAASRMRGRAGDSLDAGTKANAMIEEALKIQPDSALGLRLKAQIISMGATPELFAQNKSVPEKQAEAAVYLRQALASDPDNSAALGALGEYYRRFEWRWNDARALFERAIALDPNNSEAQLSYAYYLSGVGRCIEALEHARMSNQLNPEFGWRAFGVPRALKCLGRYDEAQELYRKILVQDPSNIFLLREMYIDFMARKDADGLDKLRTYVRDELWGGAPEAPMSMWVEWTGVAVRALRGETAAVAELTELVEKDVVESRAPEVPPNTRSLPELNRSKGDTMWIQAIEFAAVDKPERAIDLLQDAIATGTLYIPETMPFGAFEFSEEVRADPRYQTLWKSDPRLVELVRLRRESIEAGQMDGILPNGQRVTPPVPAAVLQKPTPG